MAKNILHFLNVGNGDSSILQHQDGEITVIDINKGAAISTESFEESIKGNFNRKAYPQNPIEYLKNLGVSTINRFILTHPDMDHMSGLSILLDYEFNINKFIYPENNKSISRFINNSDEDDWNAYRVLKASQTSETYTSGDEIKEGLYVLSPTSEIIRIANKKEDYNISSYVLLWKVGGFKIVFAGDSDDYAWEHILGHHKAEVSDVDILIAPHHGRDSGRDYKFLDTLKPKHVFLGNAKSEHLEYKQYKKYGKTITNNQAGNILVDIFNDKLRIFIENKRFAEEIATTFFLPTKLCSKKVAKIDYYKIAEIG